MHILVEEIHLPPITAEIMTINVKTWTLIKSTEAF